MTAEENGVMTQAEKFAGALLDAKSGMSQGDYLLLLIELNMKIEEITKIDYGSICAPPSVYGN